MMPMSPTRPGFTLQPQATIPQFAAKQRKGQVAADSAQPQPDSFMKTLGTMQPTDVIEKMVNAKLIDAGLAEKMRRLIHDPNLQVIDVHPGDLARVQAVAQQGWQTRAAESERGFREEHGGESSDSYWFRLGR